ncbi:efflux RND transporter periplasmic adaptor subunit [Frateuria defendens]|uniref:efflux RND transporter periplasmic adaptor subunit n=1 Tax=Frateuria defendens TaxID=2219559 RepID=UPI00066FDFA2|nr:HlyD family secretion protein [Frateuria defendens]
MKKYFQSVASALITLGAVALALVALKSLWDYYMDEPWTRDAHVHADVVQIAPDVSGLVAEVHARDNQMVHRDQPLFVIDQARYRLALRQAEAALAERRATLAQLRREDARNRTLRDLVSKEVTEEGRSKVEQAEAALATAETAVDVARLNLERTVVRSPVEGFLGDRSVRLGDYVSVSRPVLSIVDTGSFYVDAYFEETKLRGVHVGQPVSIRLMGEPGNLPGHVQSVAAGIEDRDRSSGASLLPNVNPAFNWVRLAQRIPVRIAIDQTPPDLRLIAGRTATVTILPDAAPAKPAPAAAASAATRSAP